MGHRTGDPDIIKTRLITRTTPADNPNANQETLDFGVAHKDSVPSSFDFRAGDKRSRPAMDEQ